MTGAVVISSTGGLNVGSCGTIALSDGATLTVDGFGSGGVGAVVTLRENLRFRWDYGIPQDPTEFSPSSGRHHLYVSLAF